MAKIKMAGRIRYVEDYMGYGEYFLFELKNGNDDWRLETAYHLVNDMIPYEALSHICKWQTLGITFHFE